MSFTLETLIRDIRDRLMLSEADAPTGLVESWIDLAEPNIWRLARTRQNRRSSTLALVAGTTREYSIPTDSLAFADVYAVSGGDTFPLIRKSPNYLHMAIVETPTESPRYWAVTSGGKIIAGPKAPDSVHVEDYYLRSGLTDIDSDMANQIFPIFYDAYLYGSMEIACDYYEHDERQIKYAAKLQATIQSINESMRNLN